MWMNSDGIQLMNYLILFFIGRVFKLNPLHGNCFFPNKLPGAPDSALYGTPVFSLHFDPLPKQRKTIQNYL